MAVALRDTNGDSLTTFHGGNTQFASGTPTNGGIFSSLPGFGETTNTNAAQHTATTAGSTGSLGYVSPGKAGGAGGRSGATGGRGAAGAFGGPKLLPDQPIGIPAAAPGTSSDDGLSQGQRNTFAANDQAASSRPRNEQPSSSSTGTPSLPDHFAAGAGSSRPSGDVPATTTTSPGSANGGGASFGTSDAEAQSINARAGI
jgi:hypothetical protein